jgi:2-polyprenyl-6-methoxyphenol hydroxylase-like FAD-dependent oxidoreductase
MSKSRGCAVVVGASMGGLLAARVLSEHFERVTLVERDMLPAQGEHRRGVPQSKHAHGLLSSGCMVLERLLPGFVSDMLMRGARPADVLADAHWVVHGLRIASTVSGVRSLLCQRPVLESYVRERVLALPNVSMLEGFAATALSGNYDRVTGVQVESRAGSESMLAAELVVDATGRGSRLPRWLATLGHEPPSDERIEVELGYASALYRRTPSMMGGRDVCVIAAAPPNPRSGVALAVDAEHVMVTLCGALRDHPGATHEAMRAFARSLPAPDLFELLSSAEPVSTPTAIKFPCSKRMRYENARAAPAGVIAFGDALCSFNPVYGQGMAVAALQAELLAKLLSGTPTDLPRRFYAGAARIIDGAWTLSAGADLSFAEVRGTRTAITRVMQRYFARIVRAASTDPQVACRLIRVLQLVDPPSALLRPGMLLRVWWCGAARVPVPLLASRSAESLHR